MMSRVEPHCINQSNAIQNLPRFAIFERSGIERDAVLSYSLNRAAVNQAILAGQLHRVYIAARELRGFRFSLTNCLFKIVMVKPVAFAADVVGDPIVRAGHLAIPVDFYDRGAAFYDNGKSSSFRFHSA
jgi:hypothetical protein